VGVLFGGKIAFLAIFALPLLAQVQAGGASSDVPFRAPAQGAMRFSGEPAFRGAAVTAAPYSAERISEHVQVGEDGTRFTTTNAQQTIYRDSAGRTRTERRVMGPAGAPTLIEIQDPVAKVSYTFDSQSKIAHRTALATAPNVPAGSRVITSRAGQFSATSGAGVAGAMAVAPLEPGAPVPSAIVTSAAPAGVSGFVGSLAASSPPTARPHPEIANEELGQREIEGVLAEGHRNVQTWPQGAMGNDRPFQVVSESWLSPELHEVVLSSSSDPRSGTNTTKLVKISRAEPSASLFAPPPDYTVVDETGPFEIRWTAAQ
jgi:hypothetical protein